MFTLDFTLVQIDAVPIVVALVMMVFDIVTGFAQAVFNRDVQSSKMREGLWHKISYVGAIAVGIVMEEAMANFTADVLDFEIPTTFAICAVIVAGEVVSVVENLCRMNPDIDKVFGKLLSKDDEDEE